MRKLAINLYLVVISFRNYLYKALVTNIPFFQVRMLLFRLIVQKIGKGTSFLMGVEVRGGRNVSIGDHCVINSRVLLDGRGGKVSIGNNVDIAQETNIWTLEHDLNSNTHAAVGGPVVIGDYVWIASRCTILPGVRIGNGAVVACNSVVTKDIPPMAIVAGIPAKQIGTRDNELKYLLKHRPWFQ